MLAEMNDDDHVNAELEKSENEVADIFMDSDAEVGEEQMMDALKLAGASDDHAKRVSSQMYAFKAKEPASFMEVYGRSVFDQSQIRRRDLNVQGLGALDLRTERAWR